MSFSDVLILIGIGLFVEVVGPFLRDLIFKRLTFRQSISNLKSKLVRLSEIRRLRFLLPLLIVTVLGITYSLWFRERLWPDSRVVVVLAVFSHDTLDQDLRNAWLRTSSRIEEGLEKFKTEIKLVEYTSMVKTPEKSRHIKGLKNARIVIWGRFFHMGNMFVIEPHVTLLDVPSMIECQIGQPKSAQMSLGPALYQPDVINLVVTKADEVVNIVWLTYGLIKYDKRLFDEAIQAFHKITPQTTTTLFYLASSFIQKPNPNFSRAESLFRQAVTLDSTNERIWLNWGAVLYYQKNYNEAIEQFKMAIRLKPDYAGAFYNWGLAFHEMKQYDSAAVKYEKAILIDSTFARAWYNWGLALGKMGKHNDAVPRFQKAAELRPKHAQTWYNWGVALGEIGEHKNAISKYMRATELKPDYSEAWDNWGVSLGKLSKSREALVMFERAVKLSPELANSWNNWGAALLELRRYREAVPKFEKANQLRSCYSIALNNLGVSLLNLSKYDSALVALDSAIKCESDNAGALVNRAVVLMKMNKQDEAKKELMKAWELAEKQNDNNLIRQIKELLAKLQ